MYGIIFTTILVIILIWNAIKLFNNKRKMASFEEIDEYLLDILNEGDHLE
ncbi:hypothetical protein ACFSO7_23245 [Bacillus sp. CGMCC 1.16607]